MTRDPVVHLHALCWNDARLLPYFFRHYDPIIDQYHIYDNGSDDGSIELLNRHPRVSLGTFENAGDSFVDQAREINNSVWKASRDVADWVIVCNIDEFLWHPTFLEHLAARAAAGDTLLPAEGYQMVAPVFPRRNRALVESVRRGTRLSIMDKVCVFRPDMIDEIGYGVGRHHVAPTGIVQFSEEPALKLLHYKYLGPLYVARRHRALRRRLRSGDRSAGWGQHWQAGDLELMRKYVWTWRKAEAVVGGSADEPEAAW
jgi:glycosyl transferase family 2